MTVIGCGHLGATHAACMVALGHEVLGVDVDEDKVRLLNSGKAWFHEPELNPMLEQMVADGKLRFTSDFAEAATFAALHFIGVATPGQADSSYDLSQVYAATSSLVSHLQGDALIVGKSTVPPGTAAALQDFVRQIASDRGVVEPEIAWNPEFLREGHAVRDTLEPDRIVVGTSSATALATIQAVYQPQIDAGIPFLATDLPTAELVKGAANSFLAAKISFANAMADVCIATGGDIEVLVEALGLDARIGSEFLRAGIGYGGACLPKDVRGLASFAETIGAKNAVQLLGAVEAVNATRRDQVLSLVRDAVGGVDGKRIAVWGAAFKPGTDDVRDSPGLQLAHALHELGAQVTIYDPMAMDNALDISPDLGFADSPSSAVSGADALVVTTCWPEFADVKPEDIEPIAAGNLVVDACQGIEAARWQRAGWRALSLTASPKAQP